MLRIRLGQRWKHDGTADALDAFRLELDGVGLVPGASEEPLGPVMEQLLAATAALAAGQSAAQVSLPESTQELLLARLGDELSLRVLRLGRPAGEVRRSVTLDLAAWRRAVVRAAREWIEDLRVTGAPARLRQRARALLAQADREPLLVRAIAPNWSLRFEPSTLPGFRIEADDQSGLLSVHGKRATVPVAPLAIVGHLSLVSTDVAHSELTGPVGLLALELLRQGEEVVHALEAGEPTLRFQPAGLLPAWDVDLTEGTVAAPGWVLPWPAVELVRALVAPALAFASLLPALEVRLSTNPHLLDFKTRGRAALAALRALVARPAPARLVSPRRPPRTSPPLHRVARARRLGFVRRGHASGLAGEGIAELHATGAGFAVVGRSRATVVTPDGQVLRRWSAAQGIAVGPGGEALLAANGRWLRALLDEPDARWLREFDGVALRGPLLPAGAQLLVSSEGEGVRAVARFTGCELWRFLPQRPQRLHLAIHAGRVLVASESGTLHGLDAAQGAVRFRIATPLPCLHPPVAWGRGVAVALGRAERGALLVAEAQTGTLRWLKELPMACAAPPVARGARVRFLGRRDGRPVLVSFGTRGATLWERPLPLGPEPWTLTGDDEASLVTAADGSAVRVDARGGLEWRVGGQTARANALATVERRVLLIPGETVRAVDVRSGRVLAEIPVPGGLHALAANEALDVAVLDAAGDVTLWKLGASLGVVEGRGT
jgi:outer membrane protein assembly factor BamB